MAIADMNIHRCWLGVRRSKWRHLVAFPIILLLQLGVPNGQAQTLDEARNDQILRLRNYVTEAIMPSGLVRDSVVLNAPSFHPATPDAAGFALVALSAFDQLGVLPDAATLAENILSAYTGDTPGVQPERSADGHYIHFMNINTGAAAGGGWDASYSPIGSALLVAGAQFAQRHFSGNAAIGSLTQELTASIDFNAAIHPSLDGRIYLDMTKNGGGSGGTVQPWNEYMLVESLALRQPNNQRAVAVKDKWLGTDNLPRVTIGSFPTLTDSPGNFAPAFWVQQMHFFNGDFLHSPEFETFFANQQQVDKLYSGSALGQSVRYGLTAGVSPQGYHADRVFNHPNNVFSPEAVAAWGDMDTFLELYLQQDPTSDPRYQYGLVRESATQPDWVPYDAGLVDHLFLLFGLVESLHPDFFDQRVFPGLLTGDYNFDGIVDGSDFTVWRNTLGSTSDLRADGDFSGTVGPEDYDVWIANFGNSIPGGYTLPASVVPEPSGLWQPLLCVAVTMLARRRALRTA